jgi:hypothetical protein
MSNPTDHDPIEHARFLVEIPARFAVARWSRDADVATIARCILGTLKYEPHAVDTAVLRRALEGVIEQTAGGISQEETKDYDRRREDSEQIRDPTVTADVEADLRKRPLESNGRAETR